MRIRTQQLHYISGLIMSLFIALHLFNHLSAVGGPEEHIRINNALRPLYRNPVSELLLMLVVLVQVSSGMKLVQRRRKQMQTRWQKAQVYSGLYLAFFLLFHVGAVMAGRYYLHLDTNFYFGTAGLNSFPACLFFIPYYGLAVTSLFVHIAAIHAQKMKQNLLGLRPETQACILLLAGFAVILVLSWGLSNGYRGVDIPEPYRVLTGH